MLRLAAALLVTTCSLALAGGAGFARGTATIWTRHGKVAVRVEIAETDAQRGLGLMHRRALARNAGMIFLWREDVRAAFWMKDTLIPLSIAFAGRRGRILKLMDMAPCSADPCPVYDPKVAFRSALEVNRGSFKRWRVRVGDRITLRQRS